MSATASGQSYLQQESVWVTGIGLVSSLGVGGDAHWAALGQERRAPSVDESRFSPYCVHPLTEVDFSTEIARKGDLRQMGQWQRIGVYTAGLALKDAGIAGQPELLGNTDLVVAAGNGERDEEADSAVLHMLADQENCNAASGEALNQKLQTSLRPTLYLSELSNLLAGNISIVHGVARSSRTFKGEEMAGVSAVEDAVRRIGSGQSQLFLVGGAFNAERADLGVVFELCRALWSGPNSSVWERADEGGGFVPGSLGAFLVLESETHARSRGKRPYAKISNIVSGATARPQQQKTSARGADELLHAIATGLEGSLGVLSGASGVAQATSEELDWVDQLSDHGITPAVRAYGTMLGHSLEAHFPTGLALAALAISKRQFYPPFDESGREQPLLNAIEKVLVTGWGHWRGKGAALVEQASMQ